MGSLLCYISYLLADISLCRRIGFSEPEQIVNTVLSKTVAEFEEEWDITEKGQAAPTWDFMWTMPSEEAREKQFLQNALLADTSDMPPMRAYPSEQVYVADATLKVSAQFLNSMLFRTSISHLFFRWR